MSAIDNLTDADLEKMQPNAQALEYAGRLAQRLIENEGKCPVRFARQMLKLLESPQLKPSLWQRIKRFLELEPPENKNVFSLDIIHVP